MSSEVAIVGMACRFPDAPDLCAFWNNSVERRVSFQKLERQRWLHSRFYSPTARDTDRTYAETAAFIDDVEMFAGSYFKIAPRRAEVMDPQIRLVLELAREALQDAGLESRDWDRSRSASFIGCSITDYKELNLVRSRARLLETGAFGSVEDVPAKMGWTHRAQPMRGYTFPGSLLSLNAGMISQNFDMGGPSYTIDAACASSLATVSRGVDYLRTLPVNEGPGPVVLAGGVFLSLLPDTLVAFARVGAVAHRECRPFDKEAEGFVLGEGAGVLVLKRLDQALKDGDRIYAVIKGAVSNSDGRSESPLSPRFEGQVALLKSGLADADIEPGTVDYVECHGTATPTGDNIELKALAHVLGHTRTEKRQIGSVKANIGHTMSAAGVAGLIRATMAVYKGTLPPQAGFREWHPNLAEYSENFEVSLEPRAWKTPLRRAIVNSFGFGGTNGLVVLENAPKAAETPSGQPMLFTFSAPTADLLEKYRSRWMEMAAGQSLESLAYTQTLTRQHHRFATVIVARNLEEAGREAEVFSCDKPLDLQLVNASEEDSQWLQERGVRVAESGQIVDLASPDARLHALGVAWMLGHPVVLDEFFPTRVLADLPPVPLVRQRYWVIDPYKPDALTAKLYAAVSTILDCSPDTLRPEICLNYDLKFTIEQHRALFNALVEEFGSAVPSWVPEQEQSLGELAQAIGQGPSGPALPLDLTLSYETHPFLMDYTPKGRTLLPFAYAIELLAQAQGGNLPLALDKISVRRGLQVNESVPLRITRVADEFRLVEVRGPRELVAFSALPGNLSAEMKGTNGVSKALVPVAKSELELSKFYKDVAYHGPNMQGLVEISQLDESHWRAVVKTSKPTDWIPGESRPQWTVDPLLLDAVLQVALYWAHEQLGENAVPLDIERLIWKTRPRSGHVRLDWHVTSQEDSEMTCAAAFYQEDECLGRIEGFRFRLESNRPSTEADPHSVESLPGFVELQRRMKAAHDRGFTIPYFQSHDEVNGIHSQIEGRELINFSSYNYVGLSGHPEVNAASNAATERFGTSVSASRLVAGERPLHHSLERSLADFLGTEDCIALVSGYLTNVTIISHLMEAGDLILYDSLSHDCILKGVRASVATRQVFAHNDMDALEDRLMRVRKSFRRVLVVVEGVYSMDGDYPDLQRLVELRDRYKFWLMIDEAHSLGTLGPTGRGIGEHYNVARDRVDLWSGTLSKALASCGGYVAGKRNLIEYLKFTTPGFVYSVGMPPSSAAAAQAAIEVLAREPERVIDLQKKSAFFLQRIRDYGLDAGMSQATPVVPVILGDSAVAWELARQLTLRGINTCPIVYPAVEEKSARLRFFITCLHTMEQLEYAAKTTAECLAQLTLVAGARI